MEVSSRRQTPTLLERRGSSIDPGTRDPILSKKTAQLREIQTEVQRAQSYGTSSDPSIKKSRRRGSANIQSRKMNEASVETTSLSQSRRRSFSSTRRSRSQDTRRRDPVPTSPSRGKRGDANVRIHSSLSRPKAQARGRSGANSGHNASTDNFVRVDSQLFSCNPALTSRSCSRPNKSEDFCQNDTKLSYGDSRLKYEKQDDYHRAIALASSSTQHYSAQRKQSSRTLFKPITTKSFGKQEHERRRSSRSYNASSTAEEVDRLIALAEERLAAPEMINDSSLNRLLSQISQLKEQARIQSKSEHRRQVSQSYNDKNVVSDSSRSTSNNALVAKSSSGGSGSSNSNEMYHHLKKSAGVRRKTLTSSLAPPRRSASSIVQEHNNSMALRNSVSSKPVEMPTSQDEEHSHPILTLINQNGEEVSCLDLERNMTASTSSSTRKFVRFKSGEGEVSPRSPARSKIVSVALAGADDARFKSEGECSSTMHKKSIPASINSDMRSRNPGREVSPRSTARTNAPSVLVRFKNGGEDISPLGLDCKIMARSSTSFTSAAAITSQQEKGLYPVPERPVRRSKSQEGAGTQSPRNLPPPSTYAKRYSTGAIPKPINSLQSRKSPPPPKRHNIKDASLLIKLSPPLRKSPPPPPPRSLLSMSNTLNSPSMPMKTTQASTIVPRLPTNNMLPFTDIAVTNNSESSNPTPGSKKQLNRRTKSHLVSQMAYTDPYGDAGLYTGEVDDESRPHGKGKMKYDIGIFYEGNWVKGCKDEGQGITSENLTNATRERILSGFTGWKGARGKKNLKNGTPGNQDTYVYGMQWVDRAGLSGRYTGHVNGSDEPNGKGTMRYECGLIAEGKWIKGILDDGSGMGAIGVASVVAAGSVAPGGAMSVAPGMMSIAGGAQSVVSGLGMMSICGTGGGFAGMGCYPRVAGHANGMMGPMLNMPALPSVLPQTMPYQTSANAGVLYQC